MGTKLKAVRTSKSGNALCLVILSDTHLLHRALEVPDGDVLIHAGDFSMFSKSANAITDFNTWLGELPHRHKIVVPGNHEFFLEADPSTRSLIDNATVLINEGFEIEGLRIWGSPVTPLYGGAFGLSPSEDRRRLYAQIPEDIDVLVTHGPPYGILDSSPDSGMHSGCRELFDAVMRVRPKLHVFGHVHGAHGIFVTDHTTFVNACLHGVDFGLDRSPHVFRLTKR
jgi:Icc-related predicted phosphoesterase